MKETCAKPTTFLLMCLFHQILQSRRKVKNPQVSNQHLRSIWNKSIYADFTWNIYSWTRKRMLDIYTLNCWKFIIQNGYQLGAVCSPLLQETNPCVLYFPRTTREIRSIFREEAVSGYFTYWRIRSQFAELHHEGSKARKEQLEDTEKWRWESSELLTRGGVWKAEDTDFAETLEASDILHFKSKKCISVISVIHHCQNNCSHLPDVHMHFPCTHNHLVNLFL